MSKEFERALDRDRRELEERIEELNRSVPTIPIGKTLDGKNIYVTENVEKNYLIHGKNKDKDYILIFSKSIGNPFDVNYLDNLAALKALVENENVNKDYKEIGETNDGIRVLVTTETYDKYMAKGSDGIGFVSPEDKKIIQYHYEKKDIDNRSGKKKEEYDEVSPFA